MSFLVPLFLLGLAGIAVPVILHLTRRQRRNVVRFPSLMFLQRIPYEERRRRRIRHWALLALRALALALLAFAFARPFFDRSDLAAGAAAGPREVVVLVDRSYSMEIGDRLERARGEASTVFAGLGPLDRASLVAFDQGAEVLVRSTTDRARLRSVLEDLAPGSGVTRFGPALKVAQTILEESTLARGEVYLLTDFQRTGWAGDEGVRLPAGSRLVPVSVAEEAPENVQVTDVSLPRVVDTGRERVTPTARLVRRGGDGPRDVPVSLEIDGQPVQSVTVRMDADGATTATFQPITVSRAHTRGTVRVPADALPADDVRRFVVSPGAAATVRIVGGATGTEDPNLYLSRALSISQDGRFDVRARRGAPAAADLEGTDVIVLNDARVDAGAASLLRGFLEEGGGVLVALGEVARWPSEALDLLPGAPGEVTDRGRGGRLGHLEYSHPVFEVFAGPRSGDFTTARFLRTRGFTPADSARVLARFDDGTVALAERRVGRGRVLAWTSTLDTYWNDLGLQPVYLPFVHRMVEYLAGRTEARSAFEVGQVIDLASAEALTAAGIPPAVAREIAGGGEQVALTPGGDALRVVDEAGTGYLTLAEGGFYTIRPPGTEPERPITLAVNVDVEESNLATIDPEEVVLGIEAASAGARAAAGDAPDAAQLQRADQERRQSLWRWILLGALALLIMETVASNWVSRGSAVAGREGDAVA